MNRKYSFLMSLYKNDNPEWFKQALDSLLNQTEKADQVFIVCDGPLGDQLDCVLEEYCSSFPNIDLMRLPKNSGLGNALSCGLKECRNELILRADADDFSLPNRAEKQISFMEKNGLDLCSTPVLLFKEDINDVFGKRNLETDYKSIVKKMKTLCPFNHPSSAYRKSAVLKAGGYLDLPFCEDYYLWVRMYLAGLTFMNMDEALVKMRVNDGTIVRRGGKETIRSRNRLNRFMFEKGIIGFGTYLRNKVENAFREHLPAGLRTFIYKRAWHD